MDFNRLGKAACVVFLALAMAGHGKAADAAGAWRGLLKDNGDDGVPKVATGWFYSEYGLDGKMFGAFGVSRQ